MSASTSVAEHIQRQFPQDIIGVHHFLGQETIVIKKEGLAHIAQFLKGDPMMRFDFLMDLTCVDYLKFGASPRSAPTLASPSPLPFYMTPKPVTERWERLVPDGEYRFEVVHHLYSTSHNHRLRLKVPIPAADPAVESVTSLWASANWFEREVWDMFGVRFTGHPNLKRILLYDAFNGHPLHKDYPVNKRQPLIGPLN